MPNQFGVGLFYLKTADTILTGSAGDCMKKRRMIFPCNPLWLNAFIEQV
jgi:hypothetical protein